jgi:acetoin utilization protein AcuB
MSLPEIIGPGLALIELRRGEYGHVHQEPAMDESIRVSDIMTREVTTLTEEDNLERVLRELGRLRFHHLPVVDDGRVVGILSQRDLLGHLTSDLDRSRVAQAQERRLLERTFVRDVMRTQVVTVSADALVSAAAAHMLEARIGALPVVNRENRLVGIVTENDVLRLVAGRGLLGPWTGGAANRPGA